MNNLRDNILRIIHGFLIGLTLIALTIPVLTVRSGGTSANTFIFQLLGVSGTTSSSNGGITLFFGFAIVLIYFFGLVFGLARKAQFRAIALSIQFIFFALLVSLNSEIEALKDLMSDSSSVKLSFGGFYYLFVMVILNLIFNLGEFLLANIDFSKIQTAYGKKQDNSTLEKFEILKQLKEEGTITQEEYSAKVKELI